MPVAGPSPEEAAHVMFGTIEKFVTPCVFLLA